MLSTQIDRTDFSTALNHLFTTKISGNFSCPNGKKKVFGTWTCGSWAIWAKFTVWFGQREKSRGLCKIKSYAWRSCNAVRLKLLLIAIVNCDRWFVLCVCYYFRCILIFSSVDWRYFKVKSSNSKAKNPIWNALRPSKTKRTNASMKWMNLWNRCKMRPQVLINR